MHQPSRTFPLGALLALTLILSPGAVQAQYSTWTNTASGNFSDPTNWDNGVPNFGATASNAVFAVPGGTYTVTWTQNITNFTAIVSNTNQNITWDLGGNTQSLLQAYSGTALFLSPNAGETNHLTIMNGLVRRPTSTAPFLAAASFAGSSVTVTNGGKVFLNISLGAYNAEGGTLTVTGPGSYYAAADSTGLGYLNVFDGAAAFTRGGNGISYVTVDGAILTNATSLAPYAGRTVDIIDGGLVTQWPSQGVMGFGAHASSAYGTVTVGRASDTLVSVLESVPGMRLNSATLDHRTDSLLRINSNGVVRITAAAAAAGTGTIMYTNAAVYGRSDLYVNDESIVSLNDGRLELNSTNANHANYIDLANQLQVLGYNPAANTTKAPGLLRGTGQIIRTNAGVNFQIRNDGWIKPGDVSSTPGLGTLTITGGDLLMTNAVATKAGLYFEFSDTALDQIVINDGVARLTHGSNVFALASSTVNYPSPGVKWGLGTYDFLTADSIDYTPVYDNLTTVLAFYGLVQNLDYTFGVVNLDNGAMALRLAFVPEPSTVLLLVGGGLLVWRFRKRR